MFGFSAFGQFAIGQLGPVNNPQPVGGVRLPLYTQPTPPPVHQAVYWNGTQTGYPGN